MSGPAPNDLGLLQIIASFGPLGGRPLGPLGVPTRAEARLIDAGLVELRGDRLHPTRPGSELVRTREVPR